MEDIQQPRNNLWLIYVALAFLIGGGAGFWYGRTIGMETGYTQAQSEIEERVALLGEARVAESLRAPAAENPLGDVKVNPLEDVPTNPYENVKTNPFE